MIVKSVEEIQNKIVELQEKISQWRYEHSVDPYPENFYRSVIDGAMSKIETLEWVLGIRSKF